MVTIWVFVCVCVCVCVCVKVTQSCLTFCNPMDCSPPGSSLHTCSLVKNTGVGYHTPPGDLPNPGIEPRLQALKWILYYLSHQGNLNKSGLYKTKIYCSAKSDKADIKWLQNHVLLLIIVEVFHNFCNISQQEKYKH